MTLEPAGGDGTTRPPDSACSAFARPATPDLNAAVAASNGLPVPPSQSPGTDPPKWRKFQNLPRALLQNFFDNPALDPLRPAYDALPIDQLGGSGGFLSNIHIAYLTSTINRNIKPVVAVRFRAPSFADTRPAPPRMPGGQVRYFSVCQNEIASQRFIACATDDRSQRGTDGIATYVISTPGARPRNATAACGVTWLPWGPSATGVLIYRHMLPAADFGEAIQRAKAGEEKRTMFDYFPASRYYDTADYQALGCQPPAFAPGGPPKPGAPARTCADRVAPRSRLLARAAVAASALRRGLAVRGTATDRGCGGRVGRVRRVEVAVARVIVRNRCRFLSARGTFGPVRACNRRTWLRARGTAIWRLSVPAARLPRGFYRARSRAVDTAGNAERKPARLRNYLTFRLR